MVSELKHKYLNTQLYPYGPRSRDARVCVFATTDATTGATALLLPTQNACCRPEY
jgi:hypothetical protein